MKTGSLYSFVKKVLLFSIILPVLIPGLNIEVSGQHSKNQTTPRVINKAPLAPGATRTASVTGYWSEPATWGGSSVPGSGDAVNINNGIMVTVDVAASCASLTFFSSSASTIINIDGTNSLTVAGSVSMPRPGVDDASCSINVGAGTLSIGTTLTMSATTISPGTRTNNLIITTGTCTISGNITCGTTGCIFNISDAGTMNFSGNFSSIPTLTTVAGSAVNYTGSSGQTILAKTYSGTSASPAPAPRPSVHPRWLP